MLESETAAQATTVLPLEALSDISDISYDSVFNFGEDYYASKTGSFTLSQ